VAFPRPYALTGLVTEYQPDAVALEESFVGRDARVALAVGQVRGTLLVAAAKAGVSCSEYPPAAVGAVSSSSRRTTRIFLCSETQS
jgi:Holliday junction resolvasome RuvABC endonuclease subunit